FSHDFENTELIKLEQNYRSTSTILAAANALITNNVGRMGKNLWTAGEDGEQISLYAGFNELDEARYIVERIEEVLQQGNKRADVAVLYRSNAQSRVLEEGLLRQNIPYRVYGGQRFYDRLEIKNALAYMRLLVNPDSDASFERVVNVPTRGIGGKTLEDIRALARERQLSLWQSATQLLAEQRLSSRAGNALAQFMQLIGKLNTETDDLTLPDLADHVLTATGLLDYHAKEKGEKGQARVENLEELVSACRSFEPEDEELSPLQEFLDSAALDAGDTQADEYEDSVQLMTLHSAKGLEFPFVMLAGMEENLFPHRMSMEEPGRLEEERRLCYVGITRAMQKLHLSYAEVRRLHGSDTYNAPSRFIREIPADLMHEVRIKGAVQRPVSYGGYGRQNMVDEVPDSGLDLGGFALGQRVQHQKFGEGVILNFEGQGNNARVQVNFEEGSKWLVLSFAKLDAL
ncbi:MAG: 3'-5' exonuclease, partial [Pseudomonadales bacterium]